MTANTVKKVVRAVTYARVSTAEQVETGVSLSSQAAVLESRCASVGWTVVERIIEPGFSAKNLNRPGVQRLMKLVRDKEVDVVVCTRLDRLFRSSIDCQPCLKQMRSYGMEFCSVSEQIDTTSAVGLLFLQLLSSLAEFERNQLSERTSLALQFKASQGYRIGAVPFGHDEIEDGRLIPNGEEQAVIEMIGELRREGLGYRRICDALNQRGIRAKRSIWWPKTVRAVCKRMERNQTVARERSA